MFPTSLRSVVVAALLAAGFAVVLVGGAGAATPPPPAPSLFIAPTGADTNPCTPVAPCASFSHVYNIATTGQVVEVAAGDYPPQTIPADPAKTAGAHVVFQPAPGAVVTIGCPPSGTACLDVFGSHVTIRGMTIASMPPVNGEPWQGSVDTERGSDDVAFVNIDAGSLNAAASHLTVIGGDWGPSIDPHNMRIVSQCVDCLFSGLLIHDFAVAQGGHFECLSFEGGTNVTIRNSEFRSCAIFSILAKPVDPINGALIENNIFWNPRGFDQSNAIKFTEDAGGTCQNVVISYNVISDNIYDGCSAQTTVVGNIQLASQARCGPGWDYNVFVDAPPCGTHAFATRKPVFVDPQAGDFHLLPHSPAVDRGSPIFCPGHDREGRVRPSGPRADAGPYEILQPKPKPKPKPKHNPKHKPKPTPPPPKCSSGR